MKKMNLTAFTKIRSSSNANYMRLPILVLTIPSLALANENTDELPFGRYLGGENAWAVHLHGDWESRYATEGRDALDGDSLITGTFEVARDFFSLGAWYGNSPNQPYDEFKLSTALSWSWENLEWYFAYTHLRFPSDNAHDNEIGAGLVWSGLPAEVALGLNAYYSFAAEGSFIETSMFREFQITNSLTLEPSVIFGINQGYVPDGHDGANHIALRLGGNYALNDTLTAGCHIGYNWAIHRDAIRYTGDELLRDFFHWGIGLRLEF